MTDYANTLEFGVFLTPDANGFDGLLTSAQLAEVSGYDLLTVQDHPYQKSFLDAWTLLSFLGARTSAIRLSPNVANLPLRPPVVLAKAAASLDVLTGGRVELGLGAGAFWDAVVAAGGPRRTPGEAVDALAEAIELMRAFWAGGRVDFDGTYYGAHGLGAGPLPTRQIPIWIGALKPRMLRLTGRLADAWVPSLGFAPPEQIPEMAAIIDEAALAAGRSPADVRRMYNIHGRFGTGRGLLEGSPADWAEQLAGLTLEHGFSTYVLAADDPSMIERFAAEVAPAVRELVEVERERAALDQPAEPVAPTTEPIEVPAAAGADTSLPVPATPDDGTRLSGERVWDESTRPTRPEPAGQDYRPDQRAAAQHLVDIHDHLRGELAQVRDVLAQVRSGSMDVGSARSAINTMTMRQNNWTLGAYCEAYCRVVTGHHTLEDTAVFPHLRHADPGLAPVLDRLVEEHHVIHDVLDRFDRALVALVADEDGTALDGVEDAVDLLSDTLLSHLAYEERELLGPLARFGYY
ncbi:LLM class flavin-dependent oxidoreductase [Nocardioides sp. GXZ039]|uniref:LLM class flavin-dependent oxidoreductase n=1 Tax=Nocardioides sp. GXZ039 TaxID=3136018 RepID=UPI0030F39072